MTYNIHPIIVHFPIAFLFIYSFVKILPLTKWFSKVAWKHIELALLVLGVFGAFFALYTGETAEQLTRPNKQIVEMHSLFATASTWIYGLLLLGEVLYFVNPILIVKFNLIKFSRFLIAIQKLLRHNIFSKILAFLGFVSIFLTGLLGGVMVYGVSADPLASIVLKILGINF